MRHFGRGTRNIIPGWSMHCTNECTIRLVRSLGSHFQPFSLHSFCDIAFFTLQLSSSTRKRFYPQQPSGLAVVTGVSPSPRYLPSFLSHVHRLRHSHFSAFHACRFSSDFACPRRTHQRRLQDDLGLQRKSQWSIIAHVTRSEANDLYDLAHVSWVGSVHYIGDPAQHFITAEDAECTCR